MDFKEVYEKLKDDPEFAKKLEDAIENKVDAKEFYGILVEGGMDVEAAEAAMAEYQRRRGLAISDEDVDTKTLRQVAGGGSGVDCTQASDCDSKFKSSDWWDSKRCDYTKYCDELYEG